MSRIAVAGATGRVGSHVVDVLSERGHDVVRMSRSTGVDVVTGKGLGETLAGVEVIVDAATGPSPDEKSATDFFTAAARNLQQAGQDAGVQRIVVVSIVGIDAAKRGHGGYYAAKVAHEEAHKAGPIRADVLRATQFHEFVETLLQWSTQNGVGHVPRMRTQLVSARTVAEATADLATSPDAPALSEIGGPREESLPEAAALLVERRGLPVKVEAATDPGDPMTELYESGALLPGPGAKLAGPTFAEWLESAA
jgi:uncharacterized protein YbjT (DUF2867 family)